MVLRLFPLMHIFELQNILFTIKSIIDKLQTNQFNINDYITFNSTNTRSDASNKLLLPQHLNNILSRHSYFHRLPPLGNVMPILDLNMSVCLLKSKLKSYLWDHFLRNLDENNNCTLHYLCPCCRCLKTKPTSNT